MKFAININQKQAQRFKLKLNEACLLDYIICLPSWAKEIYIDGKVWYFCGRNKVVTELPLVFNSADRVYRLLKDLDAKNIIFYRKYEGKDIVRFNKNVASFVKEKQDIELGKNPEKESNSGKIPSKFGKNPENAHVGSAVENTSSVSDFSGKIPTYKDYNTNDKLLLLDSAAAENENPIAFEAIFKSPQFLENIKRSLTAKKIKFDDKSIFEVLQKWYLTNQTAMNLNKPIGTLRLACVAYVVKVMETGGLNKANVAQGEMVDIAATRKRKLK